MIELICNNQKLPNVSQEAMEWLYDKMKDKTEGPFRCDDRNVILILDDDNQESLL